MHIMLKVISIYTPFDLPLGRDAFRLLTCVDCETFGGWWTVSFVSAAQNGIGFSLGPDRQTTSEGLRRGDLVCAKLRALTSRS